MCLGCDVLIHMLVGVVEEPAEPAFRDGLLQCMTCGSYFKSTSRMMFEVTWRLYLFGKYCENLYSLELKGQPETRNMGIS